MSSPYTVKPGLVPILLLKPCASLVPSAAQKLKTEIWELESLAQISENCLALQVAHQGAVVILHLESPSEVATYLRFLKDIRVPLSQNRVRILLILSFEEDELLQKMSEYGFSESVRGGTPEKTLLFKLDKFLKQITPLVSRTEGVMASATPILCSLGGSVAPSISLTPGLNSDINSGAISGPISDPRLSSLAIGLIISELMSKAPPGSSQRLVQEICELVSKSSPDGLSPVEFWIEGPATSWSRISERRFLEIEDGKDLELALASAKFRGIPVTDKTELDGVVKELRGLWVSDKRNPLSDRYFQEVFRFMRGILLG